LSLVSPKIIKNYRFAELYYCSFIVTKENEDFVTIHVTIFWYRDFV